MHCKNCETIWSQALSNPDTETGFAPFSIEVRNITTIHSRESQREHFYHANKVQQVTRMLAPCKKSHPIPRQKKTDSAEPTQSSSENVTGSGDSSQKRLIPLPLSSGGLAKLVKANSTLLRNSFLPRLQAEVGRRLPE